MTQTPKEIEKIIIDSINKQTPELRRWLENLPDEAVKRVQAHMPVLTGEARESIRADKRKTALKKLGKRKVTLGRVYSDDPDPAKMATLEYGRSADAEHGATPEFAMFRKAADELRRLKPE